MSSGKRTVIVLVGPTASGKTSVALHLVPLLDVEIISADSRQIYRYLDIGTAKPTPEERLRVPHHCVDELLPDEEFNAGEYGVRGRELIDAIFARGHQPVVVGGSGLYVQSLIDGFFDGPGADWEYRELLDEKVRQGKLGELLAELGRVDPELAARIDPTKPRRVVRALEVYHITGKPLSVLQSESRVTVNFHPIFFGLERERGELYRRIDARCDEMLRSGLLDEIARLEQMGYGPSMNALRTVGYAEGFAFRRGEIGYDEMVRLFKQNSRRYAKRQMTWFKRDPRIHWMKMEEGVDPLAVAEQIVSLFRSRMSADRGS